MGTLKSKLREAYWNTVEAQKGKKKVAYLSIEWLEGRMRNNAALNLGVCESSEDENDAALGNGGLGRLASCFIDSCATLGIPMRGYGMFYDNGLFKQAIVNGEQHESPDTWKDESHLSDHVRREDRDQVVHYNGFSLKAEAWDRPIPGYKNGIANTLRLWYIDGITGDLYPNDNDEEGKFLRLKQQFGWSSATISDLLDEGDEFVIQINDTHGSISVAELMRQLMDERGMGWNEAWEKTTSSLAYTNHTLLPEALETWPVYMLDNLIPRQLEIIYEINRRFIAETGRHDLSIVGDGVVRMANLAVIGSFAVNGVAEMHSKLLKDGMFNGFHRMYPGKLQNKTNGITQRRWGMLANPELGRLLNEYAGKEWITDLSKTRRLERYADLDWFHTEWRRMKYLAKSKAADLIEERTGVQIDRFAMLDVQVKRYHEYKRQLLNVMHAIHLHNVGEKVRRVKVIGGKAAPGYHVAKRIISLTNRAAHEVSEQLTLVYLPNYNVSAMEVLSAAADLSEQISTAGYEASGTGNFKFMLNGAVTIGTMDGGNVEMHEELYSTDMFVFGLNVDQVETVKSQGYNPQDYMTENLRKVLDKMREWGYGDLADIVESPEDQYLTAVDFEDYIRTQDDAQFEYDHKHSEWVRKSIRQTASVGKFSTDRTMTEYNRDIWKLDTIS